MTAEIAIMNPMAVALAADSAVTIQSLRGQKIYHTNKLFRLSKHNPVGIMMFSNADMMGIPWESIIKTYRQELGTTEFDTLEAYGDHFIAHLDKNTFLFPESEQERWLYHVLYGFLLRIKKSIDDEMRTATRRKTVTLMQLQRIVSKEIKTFHTTLEGMGPLPTVPPKFGQDVRKKHSAVFEQVIKDLFGNLPVSEISGKRLRRFCENVLSKDRGCISYSGIVIAGFGAREIFPSLTSFQLEGLVNDTLRWRRFGRDEITRDHRAVIVPFAQREMVHTFMEGIDPAYIEFLRHYLTQLFHKYPEDIAKGLSALKKKEKDALIKKVRSQGQTLIQDLFKDLAERRTERHVNPVIRTVEFLPITELASMAESLVNLTSFKRRITMVAETVGGPIDVAVISKGDGFIWIRRKQYFDTAPNQSFYATTYQQR